MLFSKKLTVVDKRRRGSKMTKNWLTSVANASLRYPREKEIHQILGKGPDKDNSFSLESPL